jgi:hypothetical protein
MRFHIFASQNSHKNTSKELRKFVVEDEEMYETAVEELEGQGYEINDTWVQDGDRIRINTQRQQSKNPGRRIRGGYYPPR